MSMLSKGLKKLGHNVSHVVSTNVRGLGRTQEKINDVLRPIAGFIPGVGPLMMAAADASASVMAGHNLKHTAGQAAKGATAGLVSKGIGKLGKFAEQIPGVSQVEGALSHVPGLGGLAGDAGLELPAGGPTPFGGLSDAQIAGAAGIPIQSAGGLGGAVMGGLGAIGSYAKKHPDQILAGAQGIMGAMDAKKAGQLERDALNRSRSAYDAKAGIRQMGIDQIQKAMTMTPDLSSTYPQYSAHLFSGLKRVS